MDERELIDEVKALGKDLESFLDSNGFEPKAIVLFSACLCIWAANVGYLKPLVTVVNGSLKDGTRLEIVNGGERKA